MSEFLKPQIPLQHKEGAYIYPLTTADQVILEDNTRLNAVLDNKVDQSQEGMTAMFASGETILSEHQFGTELPTAGVPGRLFFKVESTLQAAEEVSF